MPEKPAADRGSRTLPAYVHLATLSRPCRVEHLLGYCRDTACSMMFPAEHLSVLVFVAPFDDNAGPEHPRPDSIQTINRAMEKAFLRPRRLGSSEKYDC